MSPAPAVRPLRARGSTRAPGLEPGSRSPGAGDAPAGPLVEAVGAVLPTPDRTRLLRACLHRGQAGREAWEAWLERAGAPHAPFAPGDAEPRRLAPLLHAAWRRAGVPLDDRVATTLRTARFREQLRTRTLRGVLASALRRLHDARIEVMVAGGAAAAETVYPEPELRHTSGLDLLVSPNDVHRAVDRLLEDAWRVDGAGARHAGSLRPEGDRRRDPERRAIRLMHASGVPLRLSSRLFTGPYHDLPLDDLRSRSEERLVAGAPARVPSPADALVETCGQAPAYGTDGVLWVCDAWFLLERHSDLDWDAFLAAAARARVALPASVTLRYLARALRMDVPGRVLDALGSDAARVNGPERDAALVWARSGSRSYAALLRRIRGRAARLRVVGWLLLPSAAHMRAVHGARGGFGLGWGYARRLARFLSWHAGVRPRGGPARVPCA